MRYFIFFSFVAAATLCLPGCGGSSDVTESGADYASRVDNPVPASDATEIDSGSDDIATEFMDRDESAMTTDTEPRFDHRESTKAEKSPALIDDPQKQVTANRKRFQPGTLTAGSINDHANYKTYRDYLSTAMQSKQGIHLPQLALNRRVEIRVLDHNDRGIGDARVIIHRIDSQFNGTQNNVSSEKPLLSITTGTDGKTLFLPGVDLDENSNEFHLTVIPPGGADAVSRKVSLDQTPWKVTLPKTESRLPRSLDLALVIDTTGSMGDELEYLKSEIDDIANAIQDRFPNVKQRFALILYRDEGDRYVTRMFDFTGSVSEFRQTLSEQHAEGGGDYPEAMHLALEQSAKLSWQETGTAKVLFLVGDAPPHRRFAQRTLDAVLALRLSGVTMFPVAASGVRDEAEFVMRAASFLTMGQYLFLTDHSGVGNPHAKPHAPRYEIEKLNQLMIRMIASQLAGRWIPPHEIIAAEEFDENSPIETSSENHHQPHHSHQHSESTLVPADPKVGGHVWGHSGMIQSLDSFTSILRWIGIPALVLFLIFAERRWAA